MPTRATRSDSAEKTARGIRRTTRRQYSAERRSALFSKGYVRDQYRQALP
jgi:hypothetical protein